MIINHPTPHFLHCIPITKAFSYDIDNIYTDIDIYVIG